MPINIFDLDENSCDEFADLVQQNTLSIMRPNETIVEPFCSDWQEHVQIPPFFQYFKGICRKNQFHIINSFSMSNSLFSAIYTGVTIDRSFYLECSNVFKKASIQIFG